MIPVKYKNIIYAEEKYIMQQCNCLTINSTWFIENSC